MPESIEETTDRINTIVGNARISLSDFTRTYTTITRGTSDGIWDTVRNMVSTEDDHIEEDVFDEETKVTLRDGKTAKVKNCCRIRNNWYLLTNKDVIKDDFTQGYTLKGYEVTYIKDFEEDGTPIYGKTDVNNAKNRIPVEVYNHNTSYILDYDMISKSKLVENYSHGTLTNPGHPDLKKLNDISKIKTYLTFRNYFSNRHLTLQQQFKLGLKSPTHSICEGINYSFGIELEVSRGFLPEWKAYHKLLNVMCVRDGSLNGGEGGGEYVTGVLTGDTGFNQLQELCLELSKRTKVNNSCGMHLHIGNINFTNQFLVNSYVLALLLEDEIFSLLPDSRRNNRYCKRLKKFKFRVALNNSKNNIELEEDYNTLFRYIAVEKVNNPTFEYNKNSQHPMGAKCGYSHDTPRYCWLNYVPAVFNTRNSIESKTIEIRNHSGTTNFTKTKNWTLLFMAFCKFTEEYPELIKEGITIEDIINKVLPKKAKSLMIYFNTRKKLFNGNSDEDTDSYEDSKKSIKELINN